MKNQCDGCNRRMPIREGEYGKIHVRPEDGVAYMTCEAGLYGSVPCDPGPRLEGDGDNIRTVCEADHAEQTRIQWNDATGDACSDQDVILAIENGAWEQAAADSVAETDRLCDRLCDDENHGEEFSGRKFLDELAERLDGDAPLTHPELNAREILAQQRENSERAERDRELDEAEQDWNRRQADVAARREARLNFFRNAGLESGLRAGQKLGEIRSTQYGNVSIAGKNIDEAVERKMKQAVEEKMRWIGPLLDAIFPEEVADVPEGEKFSEAHEADGEISNELYVEFSSTENGPICPQCGKYETVSEEETVRYEDGTLSVQMTCTQFFQDDGCGAEWDELYKLVGYNFDAEKS